MLDFDKNAAFGLASACEVTRWIYIIIIIWWMSDDRFRSYSSLCEFQNAGVAFLYSVILIFWAYCPIYCEIFNACTKFCECS
jgi:hypothetical protein